MRGRVWVEVPAELVLESVRATVWHREARLRLMRLSDRAAFPDGWLDVDRVRLEVEARADLEHARAIVAEVAERVAIYLGSALHGDNPDPWPE